MKFVWIPLQLAKMLPALLYRKKIPGVPCPPPICLRITDTYYNDEYEWNDAITGTYRTLMRSMRDIGINGHVLICNTISRA